MKYTYEVTVEISDSTPASKAEIAKMIRSDVGSWEGSLPARERIHVKGTKVKYVEESEPELSHGADLKQRKWFWMMEFCYKNKLPPAQEFGWKAAEDAWNEL